MLAITKSKKKKESQLAFIVVNPKRDRSRKTLSGEVLFPTKGLAEGEVLMAEQADQRSMHLQTLE